MADVGQRHDAAHRIGIVALEGVVQRERFDVDDAGVEADLGQQRELRFHQLALGRDQQHLHLQAVAVGIEDLEVELDVLRIERHVLVRFPADHLARLGLLHPIHLDLLDDHVAPAHGDHDFLRLESALR